MKILVVAPYPPTPPLSGGRRRILEELRALSKANSVDLCCLTFDEDEEAHLSRLALPNVTAFGVRHRWRGGQQRLASLPDLAARFWSDELAQCVARLAQLNHYDWVLTEHCYASMYTRDLPSRKALTEHNIEYRIFEQIASADDDLNLPLRLSGVPGVLFRDAATQLACLMEFEQSSWTQVDLCFSVSSEERQIIAPKIGDGLVRVIPNCPDVVNHARLPHGCPRIVFIGALDYFPNVDAVVQLIRGVLPRVRRVLPGIEVIVAGRDPSSAFDEFCRINDVHVMGNPTSIDTILTTGTVLACPLRFGGGTRIKLLDAMVRGIPIIASTLAVEGLGGVVGREFLISDELPGFSEQLVELLRSASRRDAFTAAAKQHISTMNLVWSNVFTRLERQLIEFNASSR